MSRRDIKVFPKIIMLSHLQPHKKLFQDFLWDLTASSLQLGKVGQPSKKKFSFMLVQKYIYFIEN